jgi:hypothetical protein
MVPGFSWLVGKRTVEPAAYYRCMTIYDMRRQLGSGLRVSELRLGTTTRPELAGG